MCFEPFSALNSRRPRQVGIGHAEGERVLLDLVDPEDSLAAGGTAVGEHVDRPGIEVGVEHDGRAREALAVAFPDDMVALDGPRDRADDLSRGLLAVAAE